MNSNLLHFRDVSINYPGKTAFNHIDFETREHEHIAFTGENKTMIKAVMDAIAGKAIVTHGKIHYDFFENWHRDMKGEQKFSTPYHYISFLSAAHSFRSLTGVNEAYYQQRYNSRDAENSATVKDYLSAIRPVTENDFWTLEKLTDRFNLSPLLEEHLIKLSNGETKRTLLAAALLRNPLILLLENPFSGLDVTTRKEIMQLLDEISTTGINIILSTSPGEIPECIKTIVVFNEDNSLQIFPKIDFRPDKAAPLHNINLEELESLLSVGKPIKFDTIVDMKEVTIRYDEHLILDRINWTILQGDRWCLSGSNGAGKTTLLSLINGDNPQAFANNIILFDRKKGSGESIWDIKQKIGFFSAELYQFFPLNSTCLSAVESGFYDTVGLYRPSHATTAGLALRWMRLMNIGHLAQRSLRSVQPEERRLCLLARALVKNPPLLILDEPCQGLNDFQKLFFKILHINDKSYHYPL